MQETPLCKFCLGSTKNRKKISIFGGAFPFHSIFDEMEDIPGYSILSKKMLQYFMVYSPFLSDSQRFESTVWCFSFTPSNSARWWLTCSNFECLKCLFQNRFKPPICAILAVGIVVWLKSWGNCCLRVLFFSQRSVQNQKSFPLPTL